MHTLLDLQGNIPTFIEITDGKVHDVNILDILPIEPGSYYVNDCGYLDYDRLYTLHESKAYFVTRTKINSQLKRRYSSTVPIDEWNEGVRSVQMVALSNVSSYESYPHVMRRIRYINLENKKDSLF